MGGAESVSEGPPDACRWREGVGVGVGHIYPQGTMPGARRSHPRFLDTNRGNVVFGTPKMWVLQKPRTGVGVCLALIDQANTKPRRALAPATYPGGRSTERPTDSQNDSTPNHNGSVVWPKITVAGVANAPGNSPFDW
jgi:hypothetical protein